MTDTKFESDRLLNAVREETTSLSGLGDYLDAVYEACEHEGIKLVEDGKGGITHVVTAKPATPSFGFFSHGRKGR